MHEHCLSLLLVAESGRTQTWRRPAVEISCSDSPMMPCKGDLRAWNPEPDHQAIQCTVWTVYERGKHDQGEVP